MRNQKKKYPKKQALSTILSQQAIVPLSLMHLQIHERSLLNPEF